MRSAIVGLMLIGCSAARVVPASAPRSGGLDVDPVSGLGLFADERARSRTILVSGLSIDAGLIDPEVTARAWALAAEGKNPLTGAACGKPLGVWQARQRWASALGITGNVTSSVWCESDGGCELEVVGRTTDDLADDRFHLVAPFSAAGNALISLTSAVARLAPPAPNPGASGDLLGSLGAGAPVQEVDRLEEIGRAHV